MIQLIDQSNAVAGLVYRCLSCNAEFVSVPAYLDLHRCGVPDVDKERSIRPYVRPTAPAVAQATKPARQTKQKPASETLAVTAPPENLDAKKPAPRGRRPKPGSSTPLDR